MDVKLAYKHRVLEEEIYMEQPEGFIVKGDEDKVCKLMPSLHRLKQAGQVWNKTFAITIKWKLGFKIIHSDAGVYVLHHWQGGITKIILILYVNDLLLLGEDQSEIADIKFQLGDLYHMKHLGPTSSYLGIWITRDQRLQMQINLDRSTSVHQECNKEVRTSRCKQHKNTTPCGYPFREEWWNHNYWNQDLIPTDDQNTHLHHNWHKTWHCIFSHMTIMIQ